MELEKKKFFYYPCKNQSKPLIVLMGFFYCSERILKKFKEIWDENEYNLILFYPPLDFSMILMHSEVKELLNCIHTHFELIKNSGKCEIVDLSNQIYIHGISAGTVCTPILLKHMTTLDNGMYKYLLPFIKGIILDSGIPIKIEDYTNGFKNSLKELPAIRNNLNHPLTNLIFKSINMYKQVWIEFLITDMPYLFNTQFNYLVIYSENDHFFKGSSKILLDRIKSNNFANGKRNTSNILEIKFNSYHCQHFKNNPKKYKESIKELLKFSNKL